jgi:hypothetical protein
MDKGKRMYGGGGDIFSRPQYRLPTIVKKGGLDMDSDFVVPSLIRRRLSEESAKTMKQQKLPKPTK